MGANYWLYFLGSSKLYLIRDLNIFGFTKNSILFSFFHISLWSGLSSPKLHFFFSFNSYLLWCPFACTLFNVRGLWIISSRHFIECHVSRFSMTDLGLRQPRLEGEEYLSIVDEFMEAVHTRWPKAIVQVYRFKFWPFFDVHYTAISLLIL